MIDLVYLTRHTDLWNYDELRYSLRSIECYLTGIRDVYVIGFRPHWLKNVHHIEMRDTHAAPNFNILRKILRACDEPGLSDEFLLMNDDHILLKPHYAPTFPFYYRGILTDEKFDKNNGYNLLIQNTITTLQGIDAPCKNFDTHTPIMYGKYVFPIVMKDYPMVGSGMVIKSLFCNVLGIHGQLEPDCKIYTRQRTHEDLDKLTCNAPVMSTDDRAMDDTMWSWLEKKFPNKSKYEV